MVSSIERFHYISKHSYKSEQLSAWVALLFTGHVDALIGKALTQFLAHSTRCDTSPHEFLLLPCLQLLASGSTLTETVHKLFAYTLEVSRWVRYTHTYVRTYCT